MQIYPAVDLLNGKAVRLYQGDYSKATIYNSDALLLANNYVAEGAEWLHIVDLEAAKDPNYSQAKLIANIIDSVAIKIQIGGGIRTQAQIKNLLDTGAERVIIGSMAVIKPLEVLHWLKFFGSERIVLALDCIQDQDNYIKVATHAWQEISDKSLNELIQFYSPNLQHILCTDIKRDGTLQGPNINLYKDLQQSFPELQIQASGGVQSIADLQQLQQLNISGTIVGRALYANQFTLSEALKC